MRRWGGWKFWKELSEHRLPPTVSGTSKGRDIRPLEPVISAAEIFQENIPLLCSAAAHGQVSGKHSPKVRDLDLNPYRSWSTCYLDPLG